MSGEGAHLNGLGFGVGARVVVRGNYLDEACSMPVTGAVEGSYQHPDGVTVWAVMFDHTDPRLPPGGAFMRDCLSPVVDERG